MADSTLVVTLAPAQFQAALAKARSMGHELSAYGGQISAAGVEARYNVTNSNGAFVVTIVITKKPMFVPISLIQSQLKKLMGVA
jgi:hypothetical protein